MLGACSSGEPILREINSRLADESQQEQEQEAPPNAPCPPSAASTRLPHMPTSRSQRTRHSQRGLLAPLNSTVSPRPWRLTHVHALQSVNRVHPAHPIHTLELSQLAIVPLSGPFD